MKVLFTGGSGLLGREVKKLRPEWEYPSHFDFDVRDHIFPPGRSSMPLSMRQRSRRLQLWTRTRWKRWQSISKARATS